MFRGNTHDSIMCLFTRRQSLRPRGVLVKHSPEVKETDPGCLQSERNLAPPLTSHTSVGTLHKLFGTPMPHLSSGDKANSYPSTGVKVKG